MAGMNIDDAAQIIWDYMLMKQEPKAADIIWALGSHDLRVADRAAELWRLGYADTIVMSGGLGNFTTGVFEKPEADLFAERAIECGVPADVILVENLSTNTGQNVQYTKRLLDTYGREISSVIAVQKPYMERRTFATIEKQWPEVSVTVTSPKVSFSDYANEEISREDLYHILMGDAQRVIEYPRLGYITEQTVPVEVRQAVAVLSENGYTAHALQV